MSTLADFPLRFDYIESGVRGIINGRVFGITEDKELAFCYGAISTAIRTGILFCSARLISSMTSSFFAQSTCGAELEKERSIGQILGMDVGTMNYPPSILGPLLVYPLAYTVSMVGGKYIANQLTRRQPLSNRQIFALECLQNLEYYLLSI